MLTPHRENHLDSGPFDINLLFNFGVPAQFLDSCKPGSYPAPIDDIRKALGQAGTVDTVARGTYVFSGHQADRYAVSLMSAMYAAYRMAAGSSRWNRPVAGPPNGRTSFGVVRAMPANIVQSFYHPNSPFNGCRPIAGPDEPCGISVGVGVLVILGCHSSDYVSMHYPRILECVKRRDLEGLPTILSCSGGGLGAAASLADLLGINHPHTYDTDGPEDQSDWITL
jgi:hypothetical protein